MQRIQKNHIESPYGLSLPFPFWWNCMTMELGLLYLTSRIFLSRIFISHFYLASRIFYLASRIFISHLAFFISHLAFLSRIFISHLAFLTRISHFYLASRIFYLAFTSRIFFSFFIKSHLECPLQASVRFSFCDIFFCSRDIQVFLLCKFSQWWRHRLCKYSGVRQN